MNASGIVRQHANIIIAVAATVLAALPWWLIANPVAALGVPIGAIALVLAIRHPFPVCLLFIALTFFRLHEAYPALVTLRLPLAFAGLTITALIWHMAIAETIQPFWPTELKLFALFFVVVTAGIATAVNRPLAFETWTESFWKIGLMTLAIAWLPRSARDFRLAMRVLVISGMLVAVVAISNHFAGVGLVELTRVTIGRDIGSMLGDPNDLALVLLFPLSFAIALALERGRPLDRALGACGVVLLLLAIVYTQSRGGLLGVVAVFGVFGLRVMRSKILLAGLGILAALALFQAMGIVDRISGGGGTVEIDESAAERIEAWSAAINMSLARPLTGVGLNNFAPSLFDYAENFPGRDMTAHSTWFGILGETGVPGLAVFVAMIVACFRSIRRSEQRLRTEGPTTAMPVAPALLAGLVGFCAAGSFLTQGFTWPIYIMVGLTAALSRCKGDQGMPRRRD